MKGNLFWNEVASRHNENAIERQKDYEMAPDATENSKKIKGYKKKMNDAHNKPMGKGKK